jgi:2-iminobutanoate/2-iminopropanoate deaminase
MMRIFGWMALVLLATTVRAADIEYLTSPQSRSLELPFSEAVRVGDTIYLSGQIGNIPGEKKLVEGGIAPETRQTILNIKATLERHGSSLEQVVKCTVFLADIADWPAVNVVYEKYFGPNYPARSAIAGSGLALGARVEIECIAVSG